MQCVMPFTETESQTFLTKLETTQRQIPHFCYNETVVCSTIYHSFYKQGSLLFRKDFNYCRTTARGLLSPIQNCTDTEGLSSLCLKATHLYKVISLVCTSIPHSLPEAKTAECCKEEPLRSHQCYKTYHSFTTLLRIINNQMELLEFPNFISNGPYQRHKLYCSVHFSPTEQIGWHLLATGKHQKQPFFSIK